MKKKNLIAVSKTYFKIWNAKFDNEAEKFVHQKLKVYYTHYEKPMNLKAFKESLIITHEMFPDLKLKVNDIKICDVTAVIQWVYTATFTSGELFGIKAKKQKVTVPGVSFLSFKDGLVIKETGIVDVMSQMMQIGAVKK